MSKRKSRQSRSAPVTPAASKATTAQSNAPAADSRQPMLIGVVLVIITFAVYLPAMRNDFLNYDDNLYVTENAAVRGGLTFAGIRWALTALQASNWHPLTWLSHMLDVSLFGLQPWGHHLVNVLLHSANVLLLFSWLRRMTGALWRSAIVAALFAWHPLHVESVAWISERKDVLSTFFGFLSLWCYARYVKRAETNPNTTAAIGKNPSANYWLALTFFALGLLSKPMLVTWPFLMLLLDYWPLQRFTLDRWQPSFVRLVKEKIPFLLLSVASSVITVVVQKKGKAVLSLELLPFSERAQNAVVSYARYLGKAFWPVDLAVPYPYPLGWPAAVIVLSLLLIIGVCALAFQFRQRWPFLLAGWCLFLGLLVPVIGLLQVGAQSMADRYTYVPLTGIFIMVVWGVNENLKRWRMPGLVPSLTAGALLIACSVLTWKQCGYWRNSETLLRHRIAATKNNAFAHYDLGCYLEGTGNIPGAREQYELALKISPNYAKALNNVGKILANEGRVDDAMTYYRQALRYDTNHLSALNNLGVALAGKGRLTEAVALYERALQLDPDYDHAHFNLGLALEANGQWEDALQQYSEAVRLKPDYWEARYRLGALLLAHRRVEDALPHLAESLRVNPNQAQAHFDIGNIFAIKQQYEKAIQHFTESVKLSPNYAPAHKNLGLALAHTGRKAEAISELNEAVRLNPGYQEAIQQLRELEK